MGIFSDKDIKLCKKAISKLVKENKEFNDFTLFPTSVNWDKFRYSSIMNPSFNFILNEGVTKGVIIFENYNFVIKLPFIDNEDHFDYCLLEWRNFLHFKELGLEEYFAKMDYIGKIKNTYFYIQEKVYCDEKEITDEVEEIAYENARKMAEKAGEEITEEWNDRFWDNFYELDTLEKVEDFLREKWGDCEYDSLEEEFIENHINDLHEGNFGYRNNFLVVVDYSGYGLNDFQNSEDWYEICKSSHPGFKFERRKNA